MIFLAGRYWGHVDASSDTQWGGWFLDVHRGFEHRMATIWPVGATPWFVGWWGGRDFRVVCPD